MHNNEFNNFGENRKVDELKSLNKDFINKIGKESVSYSSEVYKTNEYGSSKKLKTNRTSNNFIKKLLQKSIESTGSIIGSVTASAIVIVASVVMFTNLVFNTAEFELLEIIEGYDSVSYNLYADNLEEDVDYYINISNSKEIYQFKIVDGENINSIEDLIHNTVYDFVVIGVDATNGTSVEYFSIKFYTTAKELPMYTVSWVVDDVVMETDYIEEGKEPTYDGLTPTKESTSEYSYRFIGWDKEIVAVTEDIVYTAMFDEVLNEFTADYTIIDDQSAIIYWDNEENYVVQFNTNFDNSSDSRLSYRIKLYDEELNREYIYEGADKVASINVSIETTIVSITYEFIGIYNGVERIFESIQLENYLFFNNPILILSDDLLLVDTNVYQIPLYMVTDFPDEEIYESINFNIMYNDSISENILIDEVLVNEEMIITLEVPSGVNNIKIDYIINMLGHNGYNERIISGIQEYNLDNIYILERTVVNQEYGTVIVYFDYHFINDSTTIAVKNLITNEVTYLESEINYIELMYDETFSTIDYSYYLCDLSGQALETENNFSIDVSIDLSSINNSYSFSYQNPGDVLITYNDDGTMNLYFDVTFETDDPSVYYSILYRTDEETKEIYYTESYAKYENIELANYYITYYIYKTINGVEYLIDSIAVSGGIEHIYQYSVDDVIIITDNEIRATINGYSYTFDETSFVITIDGINYNIDSNQIVYNAEENNYKIVYQLDIKPTEVEITFLGALFYHNYDYERLSQIITIKGNQYTLIELK